MSRERTRTIVLKLEKATGCNIREIFPLSKEEMRLLEKPRVCEKAVPRDALLAYAEHTRERLTYEARPETWDMPEQVEKALKTLTFRERTILQMRFGLGGGEPYLLEEVAAIFKVTRERIRQIEQRAIRRLQLRAGEHLADFID